MNKLITLIALFTMTCHAADKFRTFTSKDGSNTLKAVLLSYDGGTDKVQIQRENGRKATAPLSAFSEEDRSYVRAWHKSQHFSSPTKFKMQLKRERVKSWKTEHERDRSKKKDGEEGDIELVAIDLNTDHQYKLELENKNDLALTNLLMEYRIYYEQEEAIRQKKISAKQREKARAKGITLGKGGDGKYHPLNKLQVKEGEIRIESIDGRETQIIPTETVTLMERKMVGKEKKDMIELDSKLCGAWIRLSMESPDGHTLVREVALPDNTMKQYPWDLEKPEEEESQNKKKKKDK